MEDIKPVEKISVMYFMKANQKSRNSGKHLNDFKWNPFKIALLAVFGSCRAFGDRSLTLLLQILSKSLLHSNVSLQLSLSPPRKQDLFLLHRHLYNNKPFRRKTEILSFSDNFGAAFILINCYWSYCASVQKANSSLILPIYVEIMHTCFNLR